MASKKGGLGRGLDSLFSDSNILQTPAAAEKPKTVKAKEVEVSESVVYLKLNDIKANSAQPRKFFNEEALEELAASIKENGVIQPILVRPLKKGYELVAGERRWRASRLAGLKEIPAIVRELDEKTNALYALIENMQREDLNSIEEALGIKEIIDKYNFTQEETAKVIGKSRPFVTNALRLLKLPEEVQELVISGKLSQGHARAIAGLTGEKTQIEAANKAVNEGWSVRQIENYTSEKQVSKKPKEKKDADTKALEEKLSSALGTKVTIKGKDKGKIIIDFYSEEEAERIIKVLEK